MNNQIKLQKKKLYKHFIFIFVGNYDKSCNKIKISIFALKLFYKHIFNIKTTKILLIERKLDGIKFEKLKSNITF